MPRYIAIADCSTMKVTKRKMTQEEEEEFDAEQALYRAEYDNRLRTNADLKTDMEAMVSEWRANRR